MLLSIKSRHDSHPASETNATVMGKSHCPVAFRFLNVVYLRKSYLITQQYKSIASFAVDL